MNADDRALAIAARIADGSAVDWPDAEASPAEAVDDALMEELKAIASLAVLHRTPAEWLTDEQAPAGLLWGPLRLLAPVGVGHFGHVYRAWDARLQRQVALKLLHAPSCDALDSPTRAIEEARMLARVRHPNVLMVHGAECVDDQVGIWTEFVEGRTLEAVLVERGKLPAEDVVAIGIDLCSALAAVHEAGLLHRDVKAANVMRETGGRIVLMDFGTARDVDLVRSRAGDLSGTPLYLAPELFAGGQPTMASDIYALAVLLFRLLTGEYPVSGRTLGDVRAGHRVGAAQSLRGVLPGLPAALVEAIDLGLEADPTTRHKHAGAFGAALRRAQAAPGPVAFSTTERAHGRPSRRGLAMTLGVVAACVMLPFALDIGGLRGRFRALSPASLAAIGSPPDQSSEGTQAVEAAIRKVRLPQFPMGGPSRDGRYFPYVGGNGDLMVWEAATSASHRVIDRGESGESMASPLMSSRGDRVAYVVSSPDGARELRMVHADGTWPTVLIARETAYAPVPVDWSWDGNEILCRFEQRNGTVDLVLVPVSGGAPRVLPTFHGSVLGTARLSPDGRFVVYDGRPGPQAPQRDLFTIGIDGTPPRVLLAGPGDEYSPLWTPDGSHVFFVRDSPTFAGAQDGWTLPVADGTAQGDPTLLRGNIGATEGLFLSDSGALLNLVVTSQSEVYTATLDLAGATPPAAPTRIAPASVNNHIAPAWSPDGRSIAYMTTDLESPGTVPRRTLTIRDFHTGEAHDLHPRLPFLGGYSPTWLPDSSAVIVWGGDRSTQTFGYFRVDVRTSQTSTVVVSNHQPPHFQCSRDGRLIFADDRGIVSHDLTNGRETIMVPRGAWSSLGPFGASPDGQSIAFVARTSEDENGIRTLEVASGGARPRALVSVRGVESLRFQAWTPDGQNMLYTQWAGGESAPSALWQIAIGGGEPRDMHFVVPGNPLNPVSLSPDGQGIAYTERARYWTLWVMEHVVAVPQRPGRP